MSEDRRMHDDEIQPDDPRLTAYALNEMEAKERAEYARQVEQDPAARRAVAEIQATARQLAEALATEAVPAASRAETNGHAPAAVPGGEPRRFDGGPAPRRNQRRLIRFPQFYYVVSGLAAACFAVFFYFWERNERLGPHTQIIEVNLGPTGTEAVAADETGDTPRVALPASDAAAPRTPGAIPVENAVWGGGFVRTAAQRSSAFPLEPAAGSYSEVRSALAAGKIPPRGAVRVAELVNSFSYHDAPPTDDAPLAARFEVASAPWSPSHRLVRIGVVARPPAARPPANIVVLVDVAPGEGSAAALDRIRQSLRQFAGKLQPEDRLAIATSAAATTQPLLRSTRAAQKSAILDAIERLAVDDSARGAPDLSAAFALARENFAAGGSNRVVLAADGSFNASLAAEEALEQSATEQARSGIALEVVNFGAADPLLSRLAEKGGGHYAGADSPLAGRRALLAGAGIAAPPVARDVNFQVEFNPAVVQAYRLLGYDSETPGHEGERAEATTADEIDAGHTVTALYEIVPAGMAMDVARDGQPLKFAHFNPAKAKAASTTGKDLLSGHLRYRDAAGGGEHDVAFSLRDGGARFEDASRDFKFAAAVAGFGLALRDSPGTSKLTLDDVAAWSRAGAGENPPDDRKDFLGVVTSAEKLVQ